jgi:hypothetical protein
MAMFAAAILPAAAQGLRQEIRPEIDLYLSTGSRTRIIIQESFNEDIAGDSVEDQAACFLELALRPVFRRALRDNPNVFRSRYLTFRLGYEYSHNFASSGSSEHRIISELTARYPVPAGFVIVDRSRGEGRFPDRQGYFMVYRNRVWIEHDFKIKQVAFTPYVYDEVLFDTRFDAWRTNRIAVGLQLPVGGRVIAEPYVERKTNYRGSPHHIQRFGFKLSLFY